jgi:hypothetical protein
LSDEENERLRKVIRTGQEAASVPPGPEPSESELAEVADEEDAKRAVLRQYARSQGLDVDYQEHVLSEAKRVSTARLSYTAKIFWAVIIWLFSVLGLLLLEGFHIGGFLLSDTIIVAFLTTTTVNVLGLLYIVARWLYGGPTQGAPTKTKVRTTQ